jgi:hypothetical protein
MPDPNKKQERGDEARERAAREQTESARHDERNDEANLERRTREALEGARRDQKEQPGVLAGRHQDLRGELERHQQAHPAQHQEQARQEHDLMERFQQGQQDQLRQAQALETQLRERQLREASALEERASAQANPASLERQRSVMQDRFDAENQAMQAFRDNLAGQMERDEQAFLESLYSPKEPAARQDAMRDAVQAQEQGQAALMEGRAQEQYRSVLQQADRTTRAIEGVQEEMDLRHRRERKEGKTPELEERQRQEQGELRDAFDQVARQVGEARRDAEQLQRGEQRPGEVAQRMEQRLDELQRLEADKLAEQRGVGERRQRELSETERREREQALQREYQALKGVVATYDELKDRTGAYNREARELYDLPPKSREFSGLLLDAEHFIDERFFKPYENEFKQLQFQGHAIDAEKNMPAFAVHYEYHRRSGTSLMEQHNMAEESSSLRERVNLTVQKMKAVDERNVRERFPKLHQLLDEYEKVWREQRDWERIKKTFEDLRDQAKKKDL